MAHLVGAVAQRSGIARPDRRRHVARLCSTPGGLGGAEGGGEATKAGTAIGEATAATAAPEATAEAAEDCGLEPWSDSC